MIKVLFVCLGNICRSPMAQFVFKQMVEERGLAKGEKNRLFKEFLLQEYDKNNDYKTIKEFVNNIVDRLHQGEFKYLKPSFQSTTPETTIRNWITEFRKQKNTFRAK